MNDEPVSTLQHFPNEMVAEIARMTLDSHGIPSIVSRDDCGGMEPYLQAGLGVRLLVHESNFTEARRILDEIDETETLFD
jgi:hypothetical protein